MKRRARSVALSALTLASAVLLLACGPPPVTGTILAPIALAGTDGVSHRLAPEGDARLTVVIFFAGHCPCQAAHDARLLSLYALYHPRGVDVVAVDSEASATLERDRAEAQKRNYPFPILLDSGAALARSVGAEYATEAFILDRGGSVRYHGGIDSDRSHLRDDATPFLRNALDDLLADRAPRQAESKALGCALQTM
jgi:hypothetical protein